MQPDTARRPAFRWRWILGGLIAAALIFGARALLPASVHTVSLGRRDLTRTLVLVGRVRAASRARLGSSVLGTVREVRVHPNDRVRAGETLLVLDDTEARARVAEAAASLTDISASSSARIERVERERMLAEQDLEHARALFAVGAMARRDLEEAERRAADAAGAVEAAAGGASTGPSAEVKQARAALEAAQARLALTRVTSPAVGTVLRRDVEPGDVVDPGRVLIELATDGPIEVAVFPSEESLDGLEVAAPARVSADAYPGQTFVARISSIGATVDPEQGTVEVRLAVPDPPSFLLPEMTLSVNIETGRRSAAPVLPENAVHGLGTGEPWVAIVTKGRIEHRAVRIGLIADGWVEILDGVTDGEPVVPILGSPEPGARVRVSSSGAGD